MTAATKTSVANTENLSQNRYRPALATGETITNASKGKLIIVSAAVVVAPAFALTFPGSGAVLIRGASLFEMANTMPKTNNADKNGGTKSI